MNKKVRCAVTVAIGLMASRAQCCELAMTQGWVRMAPPMATNWAGYGVFNNPGAKPLRVGAITSPQFRSVEVHETLHDGDVARMRRVDPFEVPANGTVTLKPEGMHLMLMGPTTVLRPDMQVELSIDGCGPPLKIQLPIRADGNDASSHSHHHH